MAKFWTDGLMWSKGRKAIRFLKTIPAFFSNYKLLKLKNLFNNSKILETHFINGFEKSCHCCRVVLGVAIDLRPQFRVGRHGRAGRRELVPLVRRIFFIVAVAVRRPLAARDDVVFTVFVFLVGRWFLRFLDLLGGCDLFRTNLPLCWGWENNRCQASGID